MSDDLWDIIEGQDQYYRKATLFDCFHSGVNGPHVQETNAVARALIAKIKEIEEKVNAATCPNCGQTPIFLDTED